MTPILLSFALAQPPLPVYPAPVVVPAPVYAPPTVLPGEPYPVPVPVPQQRPMTLQEFGKCFVPTPGPHVVCLIHPATNRPVTVAFTLPDGCGCPKVTVRRREVEFKYAKHREVELQFKHRGTVDVKTW